MAAEYFLSPKVRRFYKVLKRNNTNIITLQKKTKNKTGCQR